MPAHGETACISGSEVEVNQSDNGLLSEESDLFPPWSDDSDSDDNSSYCSTSSTSPLKQVMADVESTLDHLIRLYTAIRNSATEGIQARLHKADMKFTLQDYEHLEAENYEHSPKNHIIDLRALKSHMMDVIFAQPSQVRPYGPQVHEKGLHDSIRFKDLQHIHRLAIDQLIFANLRRRNRFHHAKIDSEKLTSSSIANEPEGDPITAEAIAMQDVTSDLIVDDDPIIGAEETLRQGAEDILRRDVASEISPPAVTIDSRIFEQTESSQMFMSRKPVLLSKSEWPDPPHLDDNTTSFTCPYCYQTLAKRDATEILRWR